MQTRCGGKKKSWPATVKRLAAAYTTRFIMSQSSHYFKWANKHLTLVWLKHLYSRMQTAKAGPCMGNHQSYWDNIVNDYVCMQYTGLSIKYLPLDLGGCVLYVAAVQFLNNWFFGQPYINVGQIDSRFNMLTNEHVFFQMYLNFWAAHITSVLCVSVLYLCLKFMGRKNSSLKMQWVFFFNGATVMAAPCDEQMCLYCTVVGFWMHR